MKINELVKNHIHFRKGSNLAQVYDVIYLQEKSESEAAEILKWDLDKVKYFLRFVDRRILELSSKFAVKVSDTIETTEAVNLGSFIPTSDGYVSRKICRVTDLKILEKCYKNKDFVLLLGETGSGKTHLVRHFAYKKSLPYVRVNLNGGTTADELIGHWVPKKEGGFRWQDGVLTMFVRNGGVVALDEVNACPAEILFSLHSLTDDERTLTLTSKDGEVVRAHPNFFLVATMNPDYEGTRPLNAAFKDRFKVKLFFDYDIAVEKELIDDESTLQLAAKLRLMKAKGELVTPVSTRMLLYYRSNNELFGRTLATELFLNNFEAYEREAIKNVVEMMAKQSSQLPAGQKTKKVTK